MGVIWVRGEMENLEYFGKEGGREVGIGGIEGTELGG
jgi:hypothetical protein